MNVDTVELGRFVAHGLVPVVGVIPYPPHDLMLMCSAVLCVRPSLIIEWGTNLGISARIFYEVTKRYRIKAEIHSIDLPPDVMNFENPGRRRGMLVKGLKVQLHEGDGLESALKILNARVCERCLVYIDGDHSYSAVSREATALRAAHPRAALLFHDTQPNCDPTGPRKAIEEIIREGEGRLRVYDLQLGRPGMTLLMPVDYV